MSTRLKFKVTTGPNCVALWLVPPDGIVTGINFADGEEAAQVAVRLRGMADSIERKEASGWGAPAAVIEAFKTLAEGQ